MDSRILSAAKKEYLGKPGIIGVGRGKKGIVLLTEYLLPYEVATFQGVPVEVYVTGFIEALQLRTDKWRPAPGGVSVGHYAITAGTIGCVVHDKETGKRMILSNNHILADCNDAEIGDPIEQPGPFDQGGGDDGDDSNCPFSLLYAGFFNLFAWLMRNKTRMRAKVPRQENEFLIATLTRYIPLKWYGGNGGGESRQEENNVVDCAVATPVNNDDIEDEILEIGLPMGWVPEDQLQFGQTLQKSGRTTGLTYATIISVDTTVDVGYGSGRVARFDHQIVTGWMCDPGDSGSLVLNMDKYAVGLLYAGSSNSCIICPIRVVLDSLNITIP